MSLGDYRVTDPWINYTQEIVWPEPTPAPVGEIYFSDGTKMLVPQPVRFTELTYTGVMRAIEEGPEMAAEPSARVPAWSLLAIVVGCVLMALGWMLNDPVSYLIYSLMQG